MKLAIAFLMVASCPFVNAMTVSSLRSGRKLYAAGVGTVADASEKHKAIIPEEKEELEVAKAKVVRLQEQITETEDAAKTLETRNAKGYLVKEAEKVATEIQKLKDENAALAWPRAKLAKRLTKLAAKEKILSSADTVLSADIAVLSKEQKSVTDLLKHEEHIAGEIEQEQLGKLATNEAETTSNGLIIHKLEQADAAVASEAASTKRVAQQQELEELRNAVAASEKELASLPPPPTTTTTFTFATNEGTDPSTPYTDGPFPHNPENSNQMSAGEEYVPPPTTTTASTTTTTTVSTSAPAAAPVAAPSAAPVAAPALAPAPSPAASPSGLPIYSEGTTQPPSTTTA